MSGTMPAKGDISMQVLSVVGWHMHVEWITNSRPRMANWSLVTGLATGSMRATQRKSKWNQIAAKEVGLVLDGPKCTLRTRPVQPFMHAVLVAVVQSAPIAYPRYKRRHPTLAPVAVLAKIVVCVWYESLLAVAQGLGSAVTKMIQRQK